MFTEKTLFQAANEYTKFEHRQNIQSSKAFAVTICSRSRPDSALRKQSSEYQTNASRLSNVIPNPYETSFETLNT